VSSIALPGVKILKGELYIAGCGCEVTGLSSVVYVFERMPIIF
jgi:hypothetical protein